MSQALLSDDERAYFGALEDLFNAPGWEYLTRDLRRDLEELPLRAFQSARSYEELQAARAKAAAMTELLSAPTMYQHARDTLIQGRESGSDEE